MKKLILTVALAAVSASAFAQGSVSFANASTTTGLPAGDRNVKWDATASQFNPLLTAGGLVSSNFAGVDLSFLRAELFFTTTSSTDINTFTPVALAQNGITTFKQSTSTTAGSWLPKTATLLGTTAPPSGQVLNMAVVVWDEHRLRLKHS